MEAKHARLPERIVRYHEAGTGRAVVLVHAFPLSADQWLPQLQRTLPGWRLIAPDVRGFRGSGHHGHQDGGLEDATMATHATDVLALMDHLGIDRAVVGGLSMGGYVALAVARLAPGRLDGLILADTKATADDDAGRAKRDEMAALVTEKGPAAVADLMLPKLLGATSQRLRPGLIEVVRDLVMANTSEGIASAVRAMKLREDSTSLLSRLACPTLVTCGQEDILTPPADSEAMASVIPRAEIVVLPGVGHLSNLEAPATFSETLGGFLERIP